jgi:hypothetical protein
MERSLLVTGSRWEFNQPFPKQLNTDNSNQKERAGLNFSPALSFLARFLEQGFLSSVF